MALTEGNNDEQIKDLFTGNTSFFTVPRYQRKYVWEEKNWKQLYEDIEYSLEDAQWHHFIGTFVFQKNDISPQNTEFIIIDGQQRIITLQILFMSMIAALQSIKTGDFEEDEEINRYIDIIKDLIKRKPPRGYGINRVSIDYDPLYGIISETIISDQNIEYILQKKDQSCILSCFKYYYSLMHAKSFSEIVDYYEKLITTKFVGFNSYTEEYAYSIFETLNARGTQLKQMELMKNYLFHYLLPKDDIDIYKRFWLEAENQLFSNNLDCDDFLYHLFKCKYKIHDIRAEDLYDRIKKELNKEPEKIKEFYNSIIECVPIYTNVVNCFSDNEEIDFLLRYFKIKNNKQFRSALMALFYQKKKEKIGEKNFLKLVTQLRNFLIIYNIRGITANRIDNDVHDLAYHVFASSCERDIINSVNQFFLKDRSFFNFDDLPMALQGLRYSNHKRYTMATSGMFVYLFEILYKSEYADYEYLKDYKPWSLEHIVNDCNEEEYVSYIGNLLPLTKRLNNKCKSKSYDEKRSIYLESGFSWVKDYANSQSLEPTMEEIMARTELLASKLAALTGFNISEMKDYCEKTKKVTTFITELKKDADTNQEYIADFQYDEYERVQAKLMNKYKNQALLDALG